MAELAKVLDAGDDGRARPLLIGLQEVTEELHALLQPKLAASGFAASFCMQPLVQAPYGVALATRPPLGPLRGARFEPYQRSRMGRGVVLGVTSWPGVGHLAVGSTHLESFVGEAEDHVVRP